MLLCNDVSLWLGANLESALNCICTREGCLEDICNKACRYQTSYWPDNSQIRISYSPNLPKISISYVLTSTMVYLNYHRSKGMGELLHSTQNNGCDYLCIPQCQWNHVSKMAKVAAMIIYWGPDDIFIFFVNYNWIKIVLIRQWKLFWLIKVWWIIIKHWPQTMASRTAGDKPLSVLLMA